jgi:octaprenyl-diphosphate synthase
MPLASSIPADLAPVMRVLDEAVGGVERVFDGALRSDLPPVQRLVEHVETYRGKMLRPQLVILSAMAAPPSDLAPGSSCLTDAHLTIAAVCEMIHMATLVHDDVLDEADVRRKGATVNRLHGNEAAVILGDYLFSSAYRLCSTLAGEVGRQASLLIGQTGMTLCAGELLQLHHRQNLSLDERTYFRIVEQKTASLIAVACKLGAMQSGANAHTAERFHRFGLALGVAFQIQDDLLDLTGDQGVVGKPLHRDVELGKLTLPLIHHLSTAPPDVRGRTLLLLRANAHDGGLRALNAPAFASLLSALESTGSIAHARQTADDLVAQAKEALAPIRPSPVKSVLLWVADQVVARAF